MSHGALAWSGDTQHGHQNQKHMKHSKDQERGDQVLSTILVITPDPPNTAHLAPLHLRLHFLNLLLIRKLPPRNQILEPIHRRSHQTRQTLKVPIRWRTRVAARGRDGFCALEASGEGFGLGAWEEALEAGHVFFGFVFDICRRSVGWGGRREMVDGSE